LDDNLPIRKKRLVGKREVDPVGMVDEFTSIRPLLHNDISDIYPT
jgi:hypothetical protein